MLQARIIFAIAGIALGLFGIFRLLTQIPGPSLLLLAIWLVGALIIHDGLLSPAVVGVGWLLHRFVPDRARRYLQAGLIMSAIATVIAVPMIYLRDSQPPSKALLAQNYGGNLLVIIAIIAVVTAISYAARVVRDRSASTNPA